jgi:hypothetical protein
MLNISNDFTAYHLASQSNNDEHFSTTATDKGKGLFSNITIPEQTVIMTAQPSLVKNAANLYAKEGLKGVDKLRSATSTMPDCNFLFINHSESPNVMVNEFGHVITLHHVFSGEELLINYNNI